MGDLALLVEWRNASRHSFVDDARISAEGQSSWFERYESREDDQIFIVETHAGTPVGSVSLYHIDLVARTAELGRLMIGSPKYRGEGYASDACRTLLRYAFGELGLGLVYLEVIPSNQQAVRLYHHLGFSRVVDGDGDNGSDGTCVELIRMVIRKPDSPLGEPAP